MRGRTAPPKTDLVYRILRSRIRDLSLAPGTLLRKEEIAAQLGVSRAPVSEAIALLAEESLVEIFPQHGSFVAMIRPDDVRQSLLIRSALEIEAIRTVAQDADAELLATLDDNLARQERAFAAGALADFYALDEDLHRLIFARLNAPRVVKLVDAARAPLDRLRQITLPADGRTEGTLREHRLIVESIKSGDPEVAGAAMRAHMNQVAISILTAIERLEAVPPWGPDIQGSGAMDKRGLNE